MKLDEKERSALPQSQYALPGKRFPLNDKIHDRMAISGATRSENAGNISSSVAAQIKEKARAKLGQDHPRTHALSIGSATHLHKAGYISGAKRDEIHTSAGKKLASAKKPAPVPYGMLAPK